jgi:hypothetical protein
MNSIKTMKVSLVRVSKGLRLIDRAEYTWRYSSKWDEIITKIEVWKWKYPNSKCTLSQITSIQATHTHIFPTLSIGIA